MAMGVERDHWLALARWTPLAVLLDLDGTVLPFTRTPAEARPDGELVALLAELASAPSLRHSSVPIRYLYRAFGRNQLSQLYRHAAVGYVTPLRDGMNLVAKEYVAAQDPDDPGVLVLSRFAGASAELGDAVITNPWHQGGLAHDLDRALRMGLDERRTRHGRLLEKVARTTAHTWAEDFLARLAQCT
jgi:trehalose-6-phosphate synthase